MKSKFKNFPTEFNEWYQAIHSKPPANTPETACQSTTPEPFICVNCKFPLVLEEDLGCLVCSKCGLIPPDKTILVEEKDINEHSSFMLGQYKRVNHYKEILSQLQGNEFIKTFKSEIIDLIKSKLDGREATRENIRRILKETDNKKLFDHIAYIQKRLGVEVLHIPPELEFQLIDLFNKFCFFFENQVVTTRHNLLNYNYLIIRFLEFLGENEKTKFICQLKQKSKIKAYDAIFHEFLKAI